MKKLLASGIFLLISPVIVVAAEVNSTLEGFISGTSTFSAKFEQRLINAIGDEVETSTGEFFLARPDKFRWNYVAPVPQDIIADGQNLWVFDKELEQVTVNPQADTMNPASSALLAGNVAELNESFEVTQSASERPNETAVLLTPKDDMNEYQSITLTFRGEQLSQFSLKDSFGQTTLIQFSNISMNGGVPADTFDFVAPDGVDVVRGQVEK